MVQHNLSASATVSVAVAVCLPFCLCGKGDGTGVHNAGWGSPPPPPEPRQGKKEEEETGPFIYTQSRSTQTTPSLTLENYPVDGPPSTPSRRPRLCADSAHAAPRRPRPAPRPDSEGAATCRQVLGARCFSTSVLPTQCGREGGRGDTVGREMPSAQQTARTAPLHPSPTPLSAHLARRNPPSSDCNRPGRLQQPPLEPAPPLTPVPPLTPHTPYPRHSPDSSPRARLQSFSRLVSSPRPTPSPDPGTCSHTGCGTPTATLQGLGLVAGNAERPKRTNRTPSFAAYVEPPDPFRRTPGKGLVSAISPAVVGGDPSMLYEFWPVSLLILYTPVSKRHHLRLLWLGRAFFWRRLSLSSRCLRMVSLSRSSLRPLPLPT